MTIDEQKSAMRNFFISQLESLELSTGCDQFIRIQRMPNPVGELEKLLSILVGVCVTPPFDVIPVETKQRVISDQMIRDTQFASAPYGQVSGFNRAILYRWLNGFWQVHCEAIMNKKPELERVELTPEQSAEVDRILADWKKQLQGSTQSSFKGIEKEMAQIQQEDKERQEGKKAVTKGRVWTVEDEARRLLHDQWIRKNFDRISGKPLPTWQPEDKWIDSVAPKTVGEQQK